MHRKDLQDGKVEISERDILTPTGWTLMNFLTDSRTGFGRFRDFRIK